MQQQGSTLDRTGPVGVADALHRAITIYRVRMNALLPHFHHTNTTTLRRSFGSFWEVFSFTKAHLHQTVSYLHQ